MKNTYVKPAMVSYSRSEIMEMIGPVKTQYMNIDCPGVQASPDTFLQGKVFSGANSFTVSINTGATPLFQEVEISVPGSSPFIFYQFSRGDGSQLGSTWSVDLENFQFLGDRGEHTLLVTLRDDQGNTGTCQTTITVE
jgi:hypothetical protein